MGFEEELAKSESEDLSLDDDEYNFMNDEERESFIDLMSEDDFSSSLRVQGKPKRVPSSEEVRLREAIAPVQQEDDDSESEIEETESTLIPTSDGEINEEELAEETLET